MRLHTRSNNVTIICMKRQYQVIVERDLATGFLVGYIPGFAGAHSQAESLTELYQNLTEVVEMLLEDGEPELETEYVGTHNLVFA